jgi:hypothetical protein
MHERTKKKERDSLILCKKCHKNIHRNEPVVSHTPVVNLTGERRPIFSPFFCARMHVLPEVIDGIFSLVPALLFFFMGINEQRKDKMSYV